MKYILLITLFVSGLFASSEFISQMKYEAVYKTALTKAKNENKPLMMLATSKSCPWCRKFERQTLKKEKINSIVQKDFIPLNVDQDLKNFPEKFEVKVVPTIYFIDPKNETVIKKVLGYKNKNDFEKILGSIK